MNELYPPPKQSCFTEISLSRHAKHMINYDMYGEALKLDQQSYNRTVSLPHPLQVAWINNQVICILDQLSYGYL